MKTFKVEMTYTQHYSVEVEASDWEDAESVALGRLSTGELEPTSDDATVTSCDEEN